MNTKQDEILNMVTEELYRQDEKWGAARVLPQSLWISILGEEFGEVCRASLEENPGGYIAELVQVAAVAIAAIQSALHD